MIIYEWEEKQTLAASFEEEKTGRGGSPSTGMKPARSSSRQEPNKRNVLIISCMFLSLCMLSLLKARLCPSPNVNVQLPIKANVKIVSGESEDFAQPEPEEEEDDNQIKNQVVVVSKPICDVSGTRSDTCEVEGDVRVQGSSTTIFINNSSMPQQEWKIRPYARKGDTFALTFVKEWLLKPSRGTQHLPQCTKSHKVSAMIFSIGGFTGNLFHDFTDVLVPLFISSHQFHREVQFLVTDSKSWWVNKFILILKQLSKYEIIDIDRDGEGVHCFPRAIIGPSFHTELGIDSSKSCSRHSMIDFKDVLMQSFGLKRRTTAIEENEDKMRRPRLLIISRKNSRAFVNERGMVEMSKSLGYDVVIAEPDVNTDLSKFARLVNSADVLLGVHGAGLTNMMFLPVGAVVIQVIPLGGLEWLARTSFKEPAIGMKLKYIDYMIQEDESTLIDQYPRDHPVLKDPFSVHKQGWDAIRSVYLEKQNLRPHLGKLRNTLLEALRQLPQPQ